MGYASMGGHILNAAKNVPVGVGNSGWKSAQKAILEEGYGYLKGEAKEEAMPLIEDIAKILSSFMVK